jgi:hypothetical protein
MSQRLDEDHLQAKRLAQGLAQIPNVRVNPAQVQTNMVFFELSDAVTLSSEEIIDRLHRHYGIRIGPLCGANFSSRDPLLDSARSRRRFNLSRSGNLGPIK